MVPKPDMMCLRQSCPFRADIVSWLAIISRVCAVSSSDQVGPSELSGAGGLDRNGWLPQEGLIWRCLSVRSGRGRCRRRLDVVRQPDESAMHLDHGQRVAPAI